MFFTNKEANINNFHKNDLEYQIPFNECEEVYIGSTSQKLQHRITQRISI